MNLNETVNGFKITNIREAEELNGTFYEMTHVQSGAKAAWLKRNDENKTFSIAFRTTPEDDTGVFHILEHSVLNGSDRYPLKEGILREMRQSLMQTLRFLPYSFQHLYQIPLILP